MRALVPIKRSILWSCAATILMLACRSSWAAPVSRDQRATIVPSLVDLQPGAQQTFKVVIVATRLLAARVPGQVLWSVNDIPGGNDQVGTIDEEGCYHAPTSLPTPREIHVGAEVAEATNRCLWATVILGDGRPQYKSVHIWSEPVKEGSRSTDHLTDPHGICLGADGNLLIADQLGHRVHRYGRDGKYLGAVGQGPGHEPGQFHQPRIVATDDAGRIFVSDTKSDRPRIQVFSPAGEFLHMFAEKGTRPGMILRGHGMDFDPQGRLFTVDVDNMRVNVYSASGDFLYAWGDDGHRVGQFNAPHGLFVDRNGDVFVTGYYGPTQKFNSEGDFITAFGYGDPPDGPVYFHSVTGDRWGNVYVTVRTKEGYDNALARGARNKISLMKYNNNGDFVTSVTFSTPEHRESTAVVDAEGRIYALFEGEHEMGVEVFAAE